MKKSFLILNVLVLLVVSVLAGSAAAAQSTQSQISFVSVRGNWHDPVDNVPGNQAGQPVITNGVPTSSISWGVTTGSQSGYDFSRLIPGTQTLPPAPTPFFPLGTFTHRNFTVTDPSLVNVQLDVVLVLNVDGVQTAPLTFTFTFNHEETPNTPTPPATCPYPTPSGEGCTDRVTFVSSPSPTTFNVGGVPYTLSMSFVVNGVPVSQFITREGLVNTANLVGQFTLPPSVTPTPALTMTKSGPASMTVGQWGDFGLDIRNIGTGEAWNPSIRDILPDGSTGGMCDLTPEILSARVFASDGITPVAGKAALNPGSDYSLSYNSSNCRLDLTMLSAAARIGQTERLIIRYRTQLDNNTQSGVTLTNVAGATQWYNAASGTPNRQSYTRTLTNGTPGVLDHEDAFSVTVPASGYLFEKTVANLTSNTNPATTAAPGDRLRYTLRFRTLGQALNNFRILDEVDAFNAQAAFEPGTLALGAVPAGADITGTSSTGGSKGTGVVDIRNLNVAANSEVVIQFDITLKSSLTNGTIVTNQSTLRLASGTTYAISDDPNVNGPASSTVVGDENPTRVTIVAPTTAPSFRVQKISTDLSGDPNVLLAGETLRYTITVKNIGTANAANVTLRDAIPANTAYVANSTTMNGTAVADVSGTSPLVSGMLINSPANTTPGTMPADPSSNTGNVATITFNVVVGANVAAGTVIANQGFVTAATSGIVDQPSDDPDTPAVNDPTYDTVQGLAVGYLFEKTVANMTTGASIATTAAPGDRLRYTLRFRAIGQALNNFRIFDEVDALNGQATFVPGTLTLVASPAGADLSGMSSTGGTQGTGIVDVRNLNVAANSEILVQFDITLKSSLNNGTFVTNQSTVRLANGTIFALSDDPNVNGPASSSIVGDENPTRVTIVSSSGFRLQKISTDMTGDPNVLLAGETLRYTITAKNITNADAVNVTLRDAIPANTTYVANSTTMNGIAVTDVAGTSPLVNGMLINSPANTTPGTMPADPSSSTANVSTITFDVVVGANVAAGTVISNQGFLTASASGIVDQPTDDPDTPAVNDPTRDTVQGLTTGYIFEKTVTDLTSGVNNATTAAPGDRLRYTLRFRTNGQALNNFQIFDEVDAFNGQAAFAAGTLALVASPTGADVSNTSPTGGTKGTGVIDVRNLNVAANSEIVIQFDVTLKTGLVNNTVVTNQSTLRLANGTTFAISDDPNVNGQASSSVTGDENPTRVTIASTPGFRLQKISTDMTGDPNVLLAGETLRYTITAKNISNSDAVNVTLRDAIPANTTYVANSTTMNGIAVADVAGTSPLVNGTLIYSPANATPGTMPADPSSSTANVATITFDVVVGANVASGTVISNQGFLTASASGIVDQPSDDPDTPAANDPTRDTVQGVGASYLFEKTVANVTSGVNAATTAAPGDKLRYTLRFRTTNQALNNFSFFDEIDALNAQAAFVPGSLTLVAPPAGADVSNTNPAGGAKGTGVVDVRNLNVAANAEVVVQFEVTLRTGLVNNTIVTNQSTLRLANGTTFAISDDPNVNGPASSAVTGDENPTRVTITSTSGFRLQKISTDMTGDPNVLLAGETLRYTITAKNISTSDAVNVTLRDAIPANTTYVANSTTMNGVAVADVAGTSPLVNGKLIYSPANATPGTMPADPSSSTANVATITFDVVVGANVASGTVISNQSFLTASASGIVDQPSDDPDTPALNDPTRDTVQGVGTSYIFEKTVANVTSGVNPATTAAPGDKLRYTLRFRTTNQALNNFSFFDEIDALNTQAAFVPGSLTLVAPPAGADVSNTNPAGGAKGTGVIDVRNLNVAANAEVVVQFEITLQSGLANNTIVTNQSTLRLANGTTFAISDDPNVNGPASSAVAGDENPTRITVVSGPAFRVQKISTDMTGDPNVLLPGETLRYTLTVKNIGTSTALNVTLRDAIPANTTYVANSTTLNGNAVTDVAGTSPFVNGMLIYSPADTTPGTMPADPSSSTANVATITFNVVVNPGTPGGTIISNQGFVSAPASNIVDQPSDDPDTAAPNDPTRDIVGSALMLYAEKRVALSRDLRSPGIVDPDDVLRYTITVRNNAATPATGVVLTDAVPASTTYVANTTLLNGLPFGQPDNGVSPLVSGVTVGTIAPGATATLQFDLSVNSGTPTGTIITNQATVSSTGQPNLLTDGDGNPANGAQPTIIEVGVSQQVTISSQVTVVGGGPAVSGAQLEYDVRVVNTRNIPALYVVITNDFSGTPLAYVNGSATINGAVTGVSFNGTTLTADYSGINGPLAPNGVVAIKFRAILGPNLAPGTVVTNTSVVTWNNPPEMQSATASITIAGMPGTPGMSFAMVSGTAWHDADFDDSQDAAERALAGWTVELYRNNILLQSVVTDAAGAYRITDIEPNDMTGIPYEVRFLAPGAGTNTAMLGHTVSPFTNGLQRVTNIYLQSNDNVQGMNLAIAPNGVIYNSVTRLPIAGAIVTLLGAPNAIRLPAACFDDPAQQGQITLADGYYKFDLNFSDPACPGGADYLIGVTPPAGLNYEPGYSQIIPAKSHSLTPAFSVPACAATAADAIPSTALYCEVQPSEFAPASSIAARSTGTTYHIHVKLDQNQLPLASQIFNNHIPLDTQIMGSFAISKTTPLLNVTRGQLVPYVITVSNSATQIHTGVSIVDRLPTGFTYVPGSALLDGVSIDPTVSGQTLSWNGLDLSGLQTRTLRLLVAVGAGVSEGEYVNRAQIVASTGTSGDATATVRVVPDTTFDCTDVTGKVFNDANRNGRQDNGENGLPGVRVVTARGLFATTDQYGRYHITCAITPDETRGSNFVLKLDDRTLPAGYRLTTEQVQIKRVTRGKAVPLNFGASIHRVIAIDLSDAAFEPGKIEMREQWQPRMDLLLKELNKAPAVLRLSYVADTEDAELVEQRMEAIKRKLAKEWKSGSHGYALTIEPEVFWRLGAPPKRARVQAPKR